MIRDGSIGTMISTYILPLVYIHMQAAMLYSYVDAVYFSVYAIYIVHHKPLALRAPT